MSARGQTMVKMLFEGKNLANCDFWTKSDPYLILSRPKKGDHEFKKVNSKYGSLRGAAAIQYVNSQYIRITIANSPLCYMTAYFMYNAMGSEIQPEFIAMKAHWT